MVFEIFCNTCFLIFFIFCFFYIGAKMPEANPGEMSAAIWPQIIIVLLIFSIGLNIYIEWKKGKAEGKSFKTDKVDFKDLLPRKFVIGSVICLAYALFLNLIGYILTTFIFVIAYMSLLGEKRWSNKVIVAIIVTLVMYLLFAVLLHIPLPRGIGVFRNIALFIESL